MESRYFSALRRVASQRPLAELCFLIVWGLSLSGRWLLGAESGAADAGLSLSASSLQAQNSFSSTSAVSTSDGSKFACRHLLLLNQSAHPLMRQVGDLIRARIASAPQIERVDYVVSPSPDSKRRDGVVWPEGERAPDLYLTLDLSRLEESGWWSRSLAASVTASLGQAPWNSSYSINDDSTPPVVQFRWQGHLRHQSSRKGFETPKYRSVAENIANEVAKAVTNEIAKLHAQYGALPELPGVFYGPYAPTPPLPVLDGLGAQRLISSYGLLTHNETFWRFQMSSNPVPRLEAAIQQLTRDDWRMDTVQLTNTSTCFVRATRGGARLEVFELQDPPPTLVNGDGTGTKPGEFVAHYQSAFSRAERQSALEQLLQANLPVDTLLLFERFYSGPLRARFHSRLEAAASASPQGYLSLARMHWERKNAELALQMLSRAQALLVTLAQPSALEGRIQALAKEIGLDEVQRPQATADTFRDLGFLEITNVGQSFSVEKENYQPLLLFSLRDDGELESLCLRIEPASRGGKSGAHNWICLQTGPNSRSSTSSSFELGQRPEWRQSLGHSEFLLNLTVTPLAGGRIRYAGRVERP